MTREIAFTVPAWEPGNGPGLKPDADLGPFGCLKNASDEAIADTVIGHHEIGAKRAATEALERFRWVQGISKGDNATLGAAWSMFRNRSRLIRYMSVDGVRTCVRARERALDWHNYTEPVFDPHERSRDDLMAGADRKAKRALNAGQQAEVKKMIEQAFAEHEAA